MPIHYPSYSARLLRPDNCRSAQEEVNDSKGHTSADRGDNFGGSARCILVFNCSLPGRFRQLACDQSSKLAQAYCLSSGMSLRPGVVSYFGFSADFSG